MYKNFKQVFLFISTFFILSFFSMAHASDVYPQHASLYKRPLEMHMKMSKHWMLNLNYMYMSMSGLLDGDSSVNSAQVYADGYRNSPETMKTNMWMLGLMYMPNMRYSFMLMLPYLDKTMKSRAMSGRSFVTNSEGVGDLAAKMSYLITKSKTMSWHAMLGFTAPTGSISEEDTMGGKMTMRLPYPMQLGSGTYDLLLASTFEHELKAGTNWALTGGGIIHLGTNTHHYALGNEFYLGTWLKQKVAQHVFGILRLNGRTVDHIRGQDPKINPMMSPAADPLLQGGQRVDLLGILLFNHFSEEFWKDQSFKIEVGHPLYQHLNGPQLKASWFGMVTWGVQL